MQAKQAPGITLMQMSSVCDCQQVKTSIHYITMGLFINLFYRKVLIHSKPFTEPHVWMNNFKTQNTHDIHKTLQHKQQIDAIQALTKTIKCVDTLVAVSNFERSRLNFGPRTNNVRLARYLPVWDFFLSTKQHEMIDTFQNSFNITLKKDFNSFYCLEQLVIDLPLKSS